MMWQNEARATRREGTLLCILSSFEIKSRWRVSETLQRETYATGVDIIESRYICSHCFPVAMILVAVLLARSKSSRLLTEVSWGNDINHSVTVNKKRSCIIEHTRLYISERGRRIAIAK